MVRRRQVKPHHFHLPAQFLLGVIFLVTGSLLLLKKVGRDYLPILTDEMLIYVVAVGSILGGFYLIISKIWKPRIYF